jgi:hypothetical protein
MRITTPLERRQKLLDHRQHILDTTTPQQRKEQMELFIKNLQEWGETNFPNSRKFNEEESEIYSRALNSRFTVEENLFGNCPTCGYGINGNTLCSNSYHLFEN